MQSKITPKTQKVIVNPAFVKYNRSAMTTNRSSETASNVFMSPKSTFNLETSRFANSAVSISASPHDFRPTSIFHRSCLTSNDSRKGYNLNNATTPQNKLSSANNCFAKNKMSKTIQPSQANVESTALCGEKRHEIEKLKTELTSLINTNIKKNSAIKQSSTNLITPASDVENENEEITIASPVVKQNTVILSDSPLKQKNSPRKIKSKPTILKIDANIQEDEPKTKTKHYDSKTTQEFIKRQKTQRKLKEQEEQFKKKECEDLKKQKLQDLKQKSLQLLNKNVQKSAKKIRAKSSEIRISAQTSAQDVNTKASPHFMRSINYRPRSFDREAANNVNRRSFVLDNEMKPWRRSRSVSREPKPSQKASPVKLHKCTQDKKTNLKPSENDNNEIKECVKKVSNLLEKDMECVEKNTAATKIQTTFQSYQQRNSEQITANEKNNHSENIPVSHKSHFVIATVATENSQAEIPLIDKNFKDPTLDNKRAELNIEKIITIVDKELKSKSDSIEIRSKRETKSHEDVKKQIESIKQKLESSISETSAKDSKRDKYSTPSWLLPASAIPYPFNFISAVRQKLEIATKLGNNSLDFRIKSPVIEKHTKDISIQASPGNRKVNASIQCEIEENVIQKNVTPEVSTPVRGEIRSSRSHRCRRKLDVSVPVLKSPDSLIESKHSSISIKSASELVKSNISIAKNNSQSLKSKIQSTEDSDSDTTKNIPEIPEEELRSSLHKSPTKFSISEHLKNITFSRMSAEDISDNVSKKSSVKSEFSDHFKNITFDRQKPDNISSKKSSIHSDYLKNITFDRSNVDSIEDIKSLLKPDYHIDTSKVLSRNVSEKKSHNSRYATDYEETQSSQSTNREKQNTSRYPSDIESILSHYSKRSSWRQSTALNDSNYSEDFNSSIATHSSLPNLKPAVKTTDIESHEEINSSHDTTNSDIKTEHSSSPMNHSNGKDLVSVKQSINPQRSMFSNDLILKFPVKQQSDVLKSGSLSTIPLESGSKHSEFTNSTIHSINKIIPSSHSNSSKVKTVSNTGNAENDSTSNSVIKTANTSKISNNISSIPQHSTDVMAASQSFIQTSNLIKTLTNGSTTMQSVSLKTDSQSILHASSKQDTEASNFSKTDKNIESRYVLQTSNIPNLTKPTINLTIEKEKFIKDAKNNPNQIHLKFQAEIHLLNSFNKSLQQIVAIEKSLLDTQDKENQIEDGKSLNIANQSVQTIAEPKPTIQSQFSSVNYKRGCDVTDSMSVIGNMSALEPSVCSQDLGLSQAIDKSSFSATVNSVSKQEENLVASKNPYIGMSIGMFDQLIKDEDTRLEHFKAVLKLRDKALFDRTKGELAWLEIQKKQLRENGQLSDVTMIKKKQRGLIIKLEQERHEMQRLKQAHKQAAKERKNALREQKNIIKLQLSSTDHIPTKIKRLSRSERRQSGPLKVYRVESRTEHISETTMSRKSSLTEETVNVTTSSVITQISERIPSDGSGDASSVVRMALQSAAKKTAETEKVREALLMKEAALEKRRKEAEELLEWHRRLKIEETRVAELERQAKSLALEAPEKPRILTGAQLNQIWKGITGQHEKKFDEHKRYRMSKKSLDRFYTNARKVFREVSEDQSIVSKGDVSESSYTAEFDQSESQKMIDNIPFKHNVASHLSGSHLSSDRMQNELDTSGLDLIISQKNESPKTEATDHTTVSDKSLITESGAAMTERNSKLSEDSAQIESDVLDEIKSQMSSNSKKSIILSNISLQEMITSLKNAISACQIRSETHSTIDQKNTSQEIQDTNVSSSESQISSDIKQSMHSLQDASEKISEMRDSQIVSEINQTLSKKLSESDIISEKVSAAIDSNIFSENHEILHKQKSDSDIKSDSRIISSMQKTSSRSGVQSLISSLVERTDVSDSLPESDIQNSGISSEKVTSNIPDVLHSTIESTSIEKNQEPTSEIEEPTHLTDQNSVSHIITDSRQHSDTTKTSATKLHSDIQEKSESHIATNSERKSDISSSEFVESQSEVIKSDSHIVTDAKTKSTSEMVESNVLEASIKSKTPSDIISAPESSSEKYLESHISEEPKDNVSTSMLSSNILDTNALVLNILSEKSAASDKISEIQQTDTDVYVEKSGNNSYSKIQESIPYSEAEPKPSLNSSTLTENINQNSEQQSEIPKTASQLEVLSEIKETQISSDTDKRISDLKSPYSDPETADERTKSSNEQISHAESENIYSASHVTSELKSDQPESKISSTTNKDESEPQNLQISEQHFDSGTQKSETHVSSETKPNETIDKNIQDATESSNKISHDITDTQNKQISEQTFPSETLKSESRIQTESENTKLTPKSEDVSFEIKQSDDEIVIEITSNKSSNYENESTDRYVTNDELILESEHPNSDTYLDQHENGAISAESNISHRSSNLEKISETSDAKQITESHSNELISEDKSQIASLSKSNSTIHWSILKNNSELESEVSSEDQSLSKSKVVDDKSLMQIKANSSENKFDVHSEKVEMTQNEESELVEDNKQDETSNSESIQSDLKIEDASSGSKKEKSEITEDDLHLSLKDLSDNEYSTSSEHSEKQKLTPEDESSNKNDETGAVGVSHIDVRKRVSEILADATPPRGDKSPRVQDLYITTYDIMSPSPDGTPEIGSPTNEYSPQEKSLSSKEATSNLRPYTSEAEELLRKQLEIEQEIKRLERQQQDLPYLFVREIPNKPPPPYKPPEFPVTPAVTSVIPVRADQVKTYVEQASSQLYSASVNGTLSEVSSKDKINSQRYVFDLCKEIALDLCKPTCDTNVPSWKRPKNKFNSLVCKKPVNKDGLTSIMSKKVLQLLNFEPVIRKDSLIVRWSRKKRDHVDEILVLESQAEETEWTNYDVDEETIKDNLTSDILNSLISETAQVMNDIMNKKKRLF